MGEEGEVVERAGTHDARCMQERLDGVPFGSAASRAAARVVGRRRALVFVLVFVGVVVCVRADDEVVEVVT